MHIVCISASNIRHARNNSTSLTICNLVQQIAAGKVDGLTADIIPLVDYELQPCTGCGACLKERACTSDPVFNALYARLIRADALFVVAAHYAPIPSKLCMLLEKNEQLAFLPRFADENCHAPLYRRPVGIIGHGGGTEEILEGYKGQVLNTIANALSWPVEMQIIKSGRDNGVVIPIRQVLHSPDSIFPVQIYDWEDIRRRIEPLVHDVIGCAVSTV